MQNSYNISKDLYWVGANDRRISLFENVYPIPRGVSYNAYVLIDEKTALLDTVDKAVSEQFFENLEFVLGHRKLDYLIVNHMEPDHCATMAEVVMRYPDIKIVCNSKTVTMIKQFFNFDIDSRAVVINEGDTLNLGNHTLTFVMAPMVHWPEAMVSYDLTDKILFSADAFGTFGALNGNIFADETTFERDWLDDARRYYTNIVGKYGNQVQALLKKAATLEINMICPLHGPIWRSNISWFIGKYAKWSTYQPEENAVMIAYGSIYGHTQNAAEIIAAKLAKAGVKNIAMYDVSVTHPSVIVSEAFRCSHLIFASATYNAGIFCNMENVLNEIKHHNLQNRTVAFVENGSWAPTAGGLMAEMFKKLKNINILENKITIRSSLKDNQIDEIDALVASIKNSMMPEENSGTSTIESKDASTVDAQSLFKLSYGLFVLTSKDGDKDNGCIINTVMQITDNPKRIAIAVNKSNLSHDMIMKTGIFNVSVLTEDAPFKLFQQFGFQSGRDTDKFAGYESNIRSSNGLRYIPKYTNAFISGKVIEKTDCGTHTIFIAEVTEAKTLSSDKSVTYAYYFEHIKPSPAKFEEKTGYVCEICGFIYEGETLPEDYICPLCKHGVEAFKKL